MRRKWSNEEIQELISNGKSYSGTMNEYLDSIDMKRSHFYYLKYKLKSSKPIALNTGNVVKIIPNNTQDGFEFTFPSGHSLKVSGKNTNDILSKILEQFKIS